MPLECGSHLGPYTILKPLGAGGMGEVYRARDERLQRDVAIKVLRDDATGDPGRERRFALEARAASALNHPNILTVHDVGMENGVAYIVAELLDGESVEDLIARGKMPVRKILDVSIQIAAGLSVAHQAGIVHRDLKPANLMLTRHGDAKILDFGLAKTIEKPAEPGTTPLGNISGIATTPGMIVGTATYMSPEQVRGEPLDFRSDQFSLGLVLYEMITGQRAFSRSSAVSTMAAIVEEQPKAVSELNPGVPAPLAWCVARCLAKDRTARYASTVDLQRELETIREHLDESVPPQPAPTAPGRRKSQTWVAWLALACFVAGLLSAEWLLIPASTVDLARYHIRPLVNSAPWQGAAAWSPDGKSIAYAAQVNGVRQIFAQDLSSPMAAQITKSAADCNTPFWSRDGNKIYYFSAGADGPAIWSTNATGGSPELVQENASAAAWSPDGKTLAFLRADSTGKEPLSLWFSARGGSPGKYSSGPFASAKFRTGYLAFSVDGKTLGLWLTRWDGGSEFWMLSYPDGPARLSFSLALGANPFSWMPDRRHIVFGGRFPGSVGADLQVVDANNGRVRPLTVTTRDAIEAAVAPDGSRVAFTAAQDDFDLVEVPLDGSAVRPLLSTIADERDPAWSPAGTQLAYSTNRTGSSEIWLRSPADGWERPLVTEKDFSQAWIASFSEPVFSPDGQRIAYSVVGTGGHSIYVSNLAGGKPARLVEEDADQRSASWSPDGAWIAYLRNVKGRWALVKSRSGGGSPVVLSEGCLPSRPTWQPKPGTSIAYQSAEGLALFSGDGKDTRIVSKEAWLVYDWSEDGKRLYGVKQTAGRRRVVAQVDVLTGAERTIGELPLPAAAEISGFSLSPGGKSFATSASRPTGAIWVLEGFQRPGLGF